MRAVNVFLAAICAFKLFRISGQELIQLDTYDYDGSEQDKGASILEKVSEDYTDYDLKDNLFQKTLFNVTVNFIVPMVAISVPKYSTSGDPLDLVYQVMFAGFGILAAIVYIGLPSLMGTILKTQDYLYEAADAYEVDRSGKKRLRRDAIMFDKSVDVNHDYFINKIGLDWRECLKKTVCQAHGNATGRHYGLLAIPFRILFPRPVKNSSARDTPASEFRQAGESGARNVEDCDCLYSCFFDVLDLGMQITDMYEGLALRNHLLE